MKMIGEVLHTFVILYQIILRLKKSIRRYEESDFRLFFTEFSNNFRRLI